MHAIFCALVLGWSYAIQVLTIYQLIPTEVQPVVGLSIVANKQKISDGLLMQSFTAV